MKNGPIDKILRIQLGLYIKKPGKKFDPKKIDFDEGDCIWEMAPRYQKNAKWLKITFLRANLGS